MSKELPISLEKLTQQQLAHYNIYIYLFILIYIYIYLWSPPPNLPFVTFSRYLQCFATFSGPLFVGLILQGDDSPVLIKIFLNNTRPFVTVIKLQRKSPINIDRLIDVT